MLLNSKFSRLCTVLAVVAPLLGCEPAITDGLNAGPVAGGSYHGVVKGPFTTPIIFRFQITERTDGNLLGTGSLFASSGVLFSVHGSVRGEGIELTLLKDNGEIGTYRAEFTDAERRNLIGTIVTFGGYTETGVAVNRYEVQGQP